MISLPLFTGNNMAAAAARAVRQVVKPHIPSIKFPARAPGAAKDPTTSSAIPNASQNVTAKASTPSAPKSVSSKGTPSRTIDSSELPPKYRRKPLSEEEMEYIEKGGRV